MSTSKVYQKFRIETMAFITPRRFGLDCFMSALDKVWASRFRRMDYYDLELLLVDVLRSARLSDVEKVRLAKEAINAYTRRGYFENINDFATTGVRKEGEPGA